MLMDRIGVIPSAFSLFALQAILYKFWPEEQMDPQFMVGCISMLLVSRFFGKVTWV